MKEKHSHCSFCGTPFRRGSNCPRRCLACDNISYLNPLPVAVTLAPVGDGLVVIRRNIEPMKGTLTLPGGYIDLGETWQEAASRELHEETGISVPPAEISLYDVQNGLDDTLVVFGLAQRRPESVLQPFVSEEVQEVVLIEEPQVLGFSMHTAVVGRYFAEGGKDGPP